MGVSRELVCGRLVGVRLYMYAILCGLTNSDGLDKLAYLYTLQLCVLG